MKDEQKKWIITGIALAVGALHFVTGKGYQGPFPLFVNGYMIDILLPMALFLLMSLFQNRVIHSTLFRIFAVLGFGALWRHHNIPGIRILEIPSTRSTSLPMLVRRIGCFV